VTVAPKILLALAAIALGAESHQLDLNLSHFAAQPSQQAQASSDAQAGRRHQGDELSGPEWVKRFPTGRSVNDLAEPFRTRVTRFIDALRAARATVTISATRRPRERAYLMHYAYRIAREDLDPAKVPSFQGVHILWVHTDQEGKPDLAASRKAALLMVQRYDIVHRPALNSRHIEGLAIDMSIEWLHDLEIVRGDGRRVTIKSAPKNGAGNSELHDVGLSYGVHKLRGDPPHWSSDGH
jgi:hypothetical protein